MKNFSIFEEAVKFSDNSKAEDLGEISSISRWDFDQRETFRFCSKAPGVEYACLLIENALLLQTNRAGRIYLGVEKLSYMEPIVIRYLRIADISESVYVFGEGDWKPPRHPHMRVVNLPSDFRLAREWFLIAKSPTLHAAVAALDEDGLSGPKFDQKTFRSVKTSNPHAVARLAFLAEGLVDWSIAA